MSKLINILEKQYQIWIFLIGIVLIVGGVYFFLDIKSMEEAGKEVHMNKLFKLVYNFGGKYAILAYFEVIGLLSLISGIQTIKNKL